MNLVFMLEERSMKEFLDGLLPRVLPAGVHPTLIPHNGKSDLEKSLPRKLRAWRDPSARFVVIRDQDQGDCRRIKERLRVICVEAGRPDALIRIACRELEAWFLGDLAAVDTAYPNANVARLRSKAKYRQPDLIAAPSRDLGDLVPGYGKVSGARLLGEHLEPSRCTSPSFAQLLRGLDRLTRAPEAAR